jgi:hypothetical protein
MKYCILECTIKPKSVLALQTDRLVFFNLIWGVCILLHHMVFFKLVPD